jgi:hypothetical protein
MSKLSNKNKKIRSITAISIFAIFAFSNYAYASEITIPGVLRFVNESRQAQGLSDLKENENLSKAAADKADDMIKNNYFAHTSPAGLTPWYWFDKEGYNYKYAGENLAINFKTTEEQHKAWMDSPTHRKNILNSNFSEIGIAVAAGEINGQMAIVSVQEFGALAGSSIVPAEKETSSASEKTNIIKEGTKIAPTVLSVKDLINENLKGKNIAKSGKTEAGFFQRMADGFKDSRNMIGEQLMFLASSLVMLVLALTPLSFLALALNEIMNAVEMKREPLVRLNIVKLSS